ncbi:UV radiation resistance associated protein [Ditylenchus destructor]|uniref:UV radiation resistance associated protein n=1 Tax=Ditylenchus destructor TaxID=166010 RepID=A0AAD4R255_9BILA|nr:UV radiation resistance associated protein [Ditylenchus destructor]
MPKAAPDRRGSLESRCSSATAASVATISTMTSLVGLEASYNFQDWVRLREICNAISASRESLTEQSSGLEKAVEEQNSFRDSASEMQNKRIHLRLLRERIERTRKRIRALQYRLTNVMEEDVQREKQAKEMEQNVVIMEDEIVALNHTTSEMRSTYTPLRNELVLRRRFAINELRRIYFPSEIDMSDQETTFFNGTKRTCYCKRQDTIRANHLPIHLPASKDAKIVHTDFEISASAGYLLHLIDCFCRILHLPTKYMLFAMGSRSHFRNRSNLDLYNLFPGISPKRKKSRGYVPAVYFLDKSLPILADTVVQLRAECGLSTRERDRPVRNMIEIMLLCVGRSLSTSSPNSPVAMEPLNPFSAMSSTFF